MTSPTVTVLDHRKPTTLTTDVLVVGGGAAGVAAAVTAAERGHEVVLVEKYGFCGGGAVAGLSGTICGLFFSSADPDKPPRQTVYGFADRFVKTLRQLGGVTPPVRYGRTYTLVHDPLVWREAADKLLSHAGIRVLFHTTVSDVLTLGNRIVGVKTTSVQGPITVRSRFTIDASGDANLVAMAGLPVDEPAPEVLQNPTMLFRIGGVDIKALHGAYGDDSIMPERVSDLLIEAQEAGSYNVPRSKIFLFPTPRPNELLCNATRITGEGGRPLNTRVVADLSEAETRGRAQVREYARFIRDQIVGAQDSVVTDTGVQVGIRQSRQVVGRATLTAEDVVARRKTADGIARSPWPIELHRGSRPRLEWIDDDFYEIPYGALLPAAGEGLVIAGRCLSADSDAMASARVTAQCFSYGQAAGTAVGLAIETGSEAHDLAGSVVRAELNRLGAALDD